MTTPQAPSNAEQRPECFVIMPISDTEGYAPGHFRRVFEDIFSPACAQAGYRAVRADDVRATNMIHLDVLQRLLNAPLAICDLSSRNPNVLFELGLRQAFDRPVVLVQETSTPAVFDIAPLRYTEYRRARIYHEVLEDQVAIGRAIRETVAALDQGQGINSLVRILSLTKPASLDAVQEADSDPAFQIIRAELNELRMELRDGLKATNQLNHRAKLVQMDQQYLFNETSALTHSEFQSKVLKALVATPDRWLSAAEIARTVNISEKATLRTLSRLEKRGVVAVGVSGEANVYRLAGIPITTEQTHPAASNAPAI